MASLKFQIEGLDKVVAKLRAAEKDIPQGVKAALYQFAEEIMAVSKERVPVGDPATDPNSGNLMRSGFVALPVQEGSMISVALGYGADYALAVHENMDPKVHWHRPGSGPQYLAQPMREVESQMGLRVGDGVKETFAA